MPEPAPSGEGIFKFNSMLKNKVCTKCDKSKQVQEFYKNSGTKDGYNYYCKTCFNDYRSKRKPVPEKWCPVCSCTKSSDEFYDNKYGLSPYCIECQKTHQVNAYNGKKTLTQKKPHKYKVTGKGKVYCVSHSDKFFKFGITRKRVQKRVKQMQTGNPIKLNVVWCHAIEDFEITERIIHEYLQDKRKLGEWFEISLDFANMIGNEIEDSSYRFLDDL